MASTISAGTTSGTAIAIAGDTSGQLQLQTNGTTTAVTIDASQNVGIGTTSPSVPLQVKANSTGLGIRVQGRSSDGYGSLAFYNNANNLIYAYLDVNNSGMYFGNNTAQPINFYTNNTERMRIDSTGNLLVGTTTNYGSARTSINSAGTVLGLYCSGASGQTSFLIGKESNDASTSQVLMQFLYNSGSLGLGQINGNGSGNAAFGGYSDIRLKENVTDLPSQLDNIMALRPVEFDWKDGTGHQIGFIAQEVNEIYPDLVGVGANEMLTLTDMNKNDARFIKAIQELKATVDAQAITIAELQARLPAENT
jgi:hypothetical protein